MLTFAITLDTGEGRATIYTDECEYRMNIPQKRRSKIPQFAC
jgi:hypothetical protein